MLMLDPTPEELAAAVAAVHASRLRRWLGWSPRRSLEDVRAQAVVEWDESRPSRPMTDDLRELAERATIELDCGTATLIDAAVPARGVWIQAWVVPAEPDRAPFPSTAWHVSQGWAAREPEWRHRHIKARCGIAIAVEDGAHDAAEPRLALRTAALEPHDGACRRCLRLARFDLSKRGA